MTVFDLRSALINTYRDYVRAYVNIADLHIRNFVDEQVMASEGRLWPEPLVQLSPSYQPARTLDELATHGFVHPRTPELFRPESGGALRLYQHQEDALLRARQARSFVVTSGTGSGKSLCYFIPIADFVLRSQGALPPCAVALVVYPMNALVNSQLEALQRFKAQYEKRHGAGSFPLTFAKYTGETDEAERQRLRESPPHILLTNYVMGELLMVRQADRGLLGEGGLRFLVFDELHTYRGRQGADVAMLVRRLKARFAADGLIHIGTSATMVAERGSTPAQRRAAVADFAARFFGHPFAPDDIVEETLRPVTGGLPDREALRASFDDDPPSDPAQFCAHPMAGWIEHTLGVEAESDGRLRRREPRPLSEVAEALARDVERDVETCLKQLVRWLTHGATLREGHRPLFTFKLHQFVSQGRTLEATLEPSDRRVLSDSGQLQLDDGRLLVPLRFCRQCGQEYYHVVRTERAVLPASAQADFDLDADAQRGYLMLATQESGEAWDLSSLPESWLTPRGNVKSEFQAHVPKAVWVSPDGKVAETERAGAVKMWWQPEPFLFCLNCGEYYTRKDGEFAKLGGLTAEGRSSATTVMATTLLCAARGHGLRDKLLSFTDNRQDASLQAGHFNDFVQVTLLRAALYAALRAHSPLTPDQVATAVRAHSGLTPRDYGNNSAITPGSEAWQAKEAAFTEVLEYRLYEDLRRGWRFTRPNLEQVGLLHIGYRGLAELCQDASAWDEPVLAPLAARRPDEREALLRPVLDHLRRKLAISAPVLDPEHQEGLRRRAQQELDPFWGFDADERLRRASVAVLDQQTAPSRPRRSNGLPTVGLGSNSQIGRYLRRELRLSTAGYEDFIRALLVRLTARGVLRQVGEDMYQVDYAALRWELGDGQAPPPDPLTTRRVAGYASPSREANAFFQALYQTAPATLAALEAREHTAQVVAPGERERRERRFRLDPNTPSSERRLPYLVCSPTMELGVDIADLELVHLRNVPPTPANYAQRSGRAGRQGQPGLVVTYCGAYRQHDQYFFRNRAQMVAGSVRAPRLELANEALLRTHIHAEWLAEVGLPLGDSIGDVVELEHSDLPLTTNAAQQIALSEVRQHRVVERVLRALSADRARLQQTPWWSEAWVWEVVRGAAEQFDRAFDRWRALYRAANAQIEEVQRQTIRNPRLTAEERKEAERRRAQALRQRDLLLQNTARREESDFYPYRYLASEGFLPGYNFPSLPVRAWVPRGEGEFISRPRAVALTEFAPHNLVYHEGEKWEVHSFQAVPGELERQVERLRTCTTCGAVVEDLSADHCSGCGTLLDGSNSLFADVLEMPNVRLRRTERITSDDEERYSRAGNVQVAYRLPAEDSHQVSADVHGKDGALGDLTYALAAELHFINHGRRDRENNPTGGFLVQMEDGALPRDDDEEDAARSPAPSRQPARRRLSLRVRVTQDVLLFRPLSPAQQQDGWWWSLAYALRRGIGRAFELEESELGVDVVGEGAWRRLLFYENAEGSLGVLAQIARSPRALARCARAALEVCHFDPDNGADLNREGCAKACYECLLSFDNQMHALLLDRHAVCDTLLRLSRADVLHRYGERSWADQLAFLRERTDPRSELERRFLDALARHRLRLPTLAQYAVPETGCTADFFYPPRTVVFCDGSAHDAPEQRGRDEQVRAALRERGYSVVVLRYDSDLVAQLAAHPMVFGELDEAGKLADG